LLKNRTCATILVLCKQTGADVARAITVQIFEDPGHGWARVPKQRLQRLGIADRISTYSYQNGANAFLEEDCDLGVLITALRDRGHEIRFRTHHTNRSSKIRSFDTYRPI
jgi:hypothetical protein